MAGYGFDALGWSLKTSDSNSADRDMAEDWSKYSRKSDGRRKLRGGEGRVSDIQAFNCVCFKLSEYDSSSITKR